MFYSNKMEKSLRNATNNAKNYDLVSLQYEEIQARTAKPAQKMSTVLPLNALSFPR